MADLVLNLLFLNLIQGMVSLVWMAGLKRLAGPIPALLEGNLLGLILLLPVLAGAGNGCGLIREEGPGPLLIRIHSWSQAIAHNHPLLLSFF